MSAEQHYAQHGCAEGRFACPPTAADYCVVYPRRLRYFMRRAARSLVQFLAACLSPGWRLNAEWYLQNNPDVAQSGISAREHYKHFGRAEGRLPAPPTIIDRVIARARIVLQVVKLSAQQQGGYWQALLQFYRIYRQQGYTELKNFVVRQFQLHEHRNSISYSQWISANELGAEDMAEAQAELAGLARQPLISIVMPTYNSNLQWLAEAIESVIAQPYPHWELCIADDASPRADVVPFLENWAKRDARIKVIKRTHNGHISAASNSALALATGEWIALFDHDDLLHPFALYWVVKAINQFPAAELIYSDEDKFDEQGQRHSPYFKPNWNYDLFLSQNCFSHLGLIKRELATAIGGFRPGFEGSQDHDLILRAIEQVNTAQIVHIPKVLYHWRVHAASTAQSADSKPYAAIAGERAIAEHLQRNAIAGHVSFEGYGYRVKYSIPMPEPLVSLIIPTRNGLHLLQQCIESIEQKTRYKHYELIIVDNGSDDPATLDYLAHLAAKTNVQVIRDDQPFNFSRLNNLAAKAARGEILGLINNDIEVIAPDWLGEMVAHALRPEVGAVGAKLLFPNNTLQHGGVILGVGGVANHAHLHLPRHHHGYFARMSVIQQFSAVTAACLVVRKSVYDEVQGLDEKNLRVAFNDVDFCIRLTKRGYKNVWTPYAELYHHESATRGQDISPEKRARFVSEVNYMMDKWGADFVNDPAYNPNLNLDFPDFSLCKVARLNKWDLDVPTNTIDREPIPE